MYFCELAAFACNGSFSDEADEVIIIVACYRVEGIILKERSLLFCWVMWVLLTCAQN